MPYLKCVTTLAVGASLLFITACGEPAKSAPGIATVRSGTPTEARVSASPASGRPIIRPDASDQELIALQNAWADCLNEHGVPVMNKSDPNVVHKATVDTRLPQYKDAVAACAAKEPEDWRDVAARTDPQYADRQRVELQCFKDHGIKAELQGTPPRIVFTDDRQVGRALDLSRDCEQQAFGDLMKKFNEG